LSPTDRRRIGIELTWLGTIARKVEWATWAEQAGFDDCWIGEVSDPDPLVTLAAVAGATSTVRLGTAILPLGPRSVPSVASATAALAELSHGRFALGIGVSNPVIVEQWHGGTPAKPLGRTRETVALLRLLLAGERSDFAGEYVRSSGFRLRNPPTEAPPILVAAMGPKMLELAGEIADGVLLTYTPVAAIPALLEAVRRGAERVGRDGLPEIIASVATDVTDDEEASVERFRRELAFFLSVPWFQRVLTACGFEDEVERGRQRWAEGGIDHVAAGVSPELVHALGAIGTHAACNQRFEDYWSEGVDTISIATPMGADPQVTFEAFATPTKETRATVR